MYNQRNLFKLYLSSWNPSGNSVFSFPRARDARILPLARLCLNTLPEKPMPTTMPGPLKLQSLSDSLIYFFTM